MKTIVNLTIEPATEEQAAAGVKTLAVGAGAGRIKTLLTFEEIPPDEELRRRADELSYIALRAQGEDRSIYGAMIEAPGFFVRYLEDALWGAGITPLHPFILDSKFIGFVKG